MTHIPLLKCHGSGNDFLLIDEYPKALIAEEHKAIFSRDLCHRHLGFGADGVLYISPSDAADCTMRMFNPDGSEAQMCGNGLRCAARYYCETYSKKERVRIATPKAILQCYTDMTEQGVVYYRTEIGPTSMDPSTLPAQQSQPIQAQIITELDSHIQWYGISITNPHIVAVVDHTMQAKLADIGQQANRLSLFPEGINCSLISLLDEQTIFVSTFERGAGLTDACGTAMAASCFIAVHTQVMPATSTITIRNPGGKVFAESTGVLGEMVHLSGNASFVYKSQCDYNQHTGRLASDAGAYQQLIEKKAD